MKILYFDCFAGAAGDMILGALLVVTGFGFGYSMGVQRRFRDAVPEDVRGQAFGLLSTGLMTLQGVGPAVFGLVAEVVPVGVAMAAGGVATILTAGWIALGGRPHPMAGAESGNAGSHSAANPR